MAVESLTERREGTFTLLDLGSHAARFLSVRIRDGRDFRVVEQARARTRLANGRGQLLSRAAIRQTSEAALRFVTRARGRGIERVVVIATAAVRDARNSETLLAPLRRLGADVRLLSWHDEARFGARAALAWRALRDATVLDLGGGSLQITGVRAGRSVPLVSVPLGAVRTASQFLRHDPPTEREIAALQQRVTASLRNVFPGARPPLVGLGGSVRALARIRENADAGPRRRSRLAFRDVAKLRRRLAALPLHKRRRVAGLKADRADTIVAGAVVLETVMALGGYSAVHVCPFGVRHGVLLEAAFGSEEHR